MKRLYLKNLATDYLMPLEFLPESVFFGILILGIFAPYWLKTKDLKKISSKDLPPDGRLGKIIKREYLL